MAQTRRRSRRWSAAAALALILGAGACHHMSYTRLPGELVASRGLEVRELGRFEIQLRQHYWLWGLVKASDEQVARAVVEKVREMGGNGVKDLRYTVGFQPLDVLLSGCGSLISYHTQTVIVAGMVVLIAGDVSGVTTAQALERAATGEAWPPGATAESEGAR